MKVLRSLTKNNGSKKHKKNITTIIKAIHNNIMRYLKYLPLKQCLFSLMNSTIH